MELKVAPVYVSKHLVDDRGLVERIRIDPAVRQQFHVVRGDAVVNLDPVKVGTVAIPYRRKRKNCGHTRGRVGVRTGAIFPEAAGRALSWIHRPGVVTARFAQVVDIDLEPVVGNALLAIHNDIGVGDQKSWGALAGPQVLERPNRIEVKLLIWSVRRGLDAGAWVTTSDFHHSGSGNVAIASPKIKATTRAELLVMLPMSTRLRLGGRWCASLASKRVAVDGRRKVVSGVVNHLAIRQSMIPVAAGVAAASGHATGEEWGLCP